MSTRLSPFWRYYGAKFRAAPRYPAPRHDTIVEPFAGAAGYSLRHADRKVVLVDKYPVIAGIWRYLIAVNEWEIKMIPAVDSIDDLPGWVPQEARWLVGFCLNDATTRPMRTLSSGRRALRDAGHTMNGWDAGRADKIASQLYMIRHWTIIEGDYRAAPDVEATWFVDPPYDNRAGEHYVHGSDKIDFDALGRWCWCRRGDVIACENAGATWLPFREMYTVNTRMTGKVSTEVVWTSE